MGLWGTKHLSRVIKSWATKVKCYKAYVLPIVLLGIECWSLTKVQSHKPERVHSSCLKLEHPGMGVRLSGFGFLWCCLYPLGVHAVASY